MHLHLRQHQDFDLARVKPAFPSVRAAIEAGDFKRPDVETLRSGTDYRAERGRPVGAGRDRCRLRCRGSLPQQSGAGRGLARARQHAWLQR